MDRCSIHPPCGQGQGEDRDVQRKLEQRSPGTLNTVPEMSIPGDESHEEEAVMSLLGGRSLSGDDLRKQGSRVTFGAELTNSPSKRGVGAVAYGNGEVLRTFPLKLASR